MVVYDCSMDTVLFFLLSMAVSQSPFQAPFYPFPHRDSHRFLVQGINYVIAAYFLNNMSSLRDIKNNDNFTKLVGTLSSCTYSDPSSRNNVYDMDNPEHRDNILEALERIIEDFNTDIENSQEVVSKLKKIIEIIKD